MSLPKTFDVMLPRMVVVACVLGLFLWVFGELVFLPKSFAYRDTAHFYYPLFELIQREWAASRIPLWNPYEGAGTPLAAIPTASVFYPGKLIFWLPVSFEVAFKTYVLMHILLAAFSAYRLARDGGRSVEAAGLAAVSYAFCGSVMFQHCNVVFLCGAAWLPLALLTDVRMIQGCRPVWGIALGVILSMMTLAGDPQMAYMAGLLIAFLALLSRRGEATERETKSNWKLIQQRPVLLSIAAATGLLLSSIQVLPSVELSRLTSRAAAIVPRNVYGITSYLWRTSLPSDAPPQENAPSWYNAIIGKPPPTDAYELEITHFSLAPWRLVEFFFPNIGGKVLHQSQRLIPTQRAEHALWVPTLYMGLLPILLAIWSWRVRKTDVLTRWISWFVLIGVVGSFGAFGMGWLLRVVVQWVGGVTANGELGTPSDFPVGDSVGGLYWLLKNLLPGFAYFRYPSKLMGVAAIGLSLLAAQGWDRVFLKDKSFPCRAFVVLVTVSLVAIAGLLAFGSHWEALLHTTIVCGALWILLRKQASAEHSEKRAWIPAALLILTAFDLGAANAWTVLTAPSVEWHQTPQVAAIIEQSEQSVSQQTGQPRQPFRVYRMDFTPDAYEEQPSVDPQLSGLRWERDTLSPKHHLQPGMEMLTLEGTSSCTTTGCSSAGACNKDRTVALKGSSHVVLSMPGEPSISFSHGRNWLTPTHLKVRSAYVVRGGNLVNHQSIFQQPRTGRNSTHFLMNHFKVWKVWSFCPIQITFREHGSFMMSEPFIRSPLMMTIRSTRSCRRSTSRSQAHISTFGKRLLSKTRVWPPRPSKD